MQYDPQLTQSSHEVNRSIRECDEQGGLSSTSTRGKTVVYIAIDIEWGNKFWGTMQGALHSKITILRRLASFPTNYSSVPLIIFSSISRSCFGWIVVADSTPFTHLISPQVFSAQRSASASTSLLRRDRTDRNYQEPTSFVIFALTTIVSRFRGFHHHYVRTPRVPIGKLCIMQHCWRGPHIVQSSPAQFLCLNSLYEPRPSTCSITTMNTPPTTSE